MQKETTASNATTDSLIPPLAIPEKAQEFSERVHTLLDGQPKDEATVNQALDGFDEMFELIAAGMYSIASMLVGEGEDSIRLVESAVANAEISTTQNHNEARKASRRALCAAALDMLAGRDPAGLAAPKGLQHVASCIGDDDLDAAGVSGEELERMIAGPDRDRIRVWLESLPVAMRTIFVFRAVAGLTAAESAKLLQEHGGPNATGWSAEDVRELSRQALCSLASQVLHEANR